MSTRPVKRPVGPTRAQLSILRTIPTGEGISTREAWLAAADSGLPTGLSPEGDLTVCGYPLRSVLRFMRRTGWLIYNKHTDPPVWSRTPTGTNALDNPTARMTATPRQEATR